MLSLATPMVDMAGLMVAMEDMAGLMAAMEDMAGLMAAMEDMASLMLATDMEDMAPEAMAMESKPQYNQLISSLTKIELTYVCRYAVMLYLDGNFQRRER